MDKEPMSVQIFQRTPNENEGNLVLNALSNDLSTQYYSESIRWFKIKSVVATDETNIIRTNPSTINLNWQTDAIIIAASFSALLILGGIIYFIVLATGRNATPVPTAENQVRSQEFLKEKFGAQQKDKIPDYSVEELVEYLDKTYNNRDPNLNYEDQMKRFIINLTKIDFASKTSFEEKLKKSKVGSLDPLNKEETLKYANIIGKLLKESTKINEFSAFLYDYKIGPILLGIHNLVLINDPYTVFQGIKSLNTLKFSDQNEYIQKIASELIDLLLFSE
jgi:hypothetical protein